MFRRLQKRAACSGMPPASGPYVLAPRVNRSSYWPTRVLIADVKPFTNTMPPLVRLSAVM